MGQNQNNSEEITFSVLGAGGNQGLTTLETLVNDVWNTDFENGLLDKRDEITRIEAVERDKDNYEGIIKSLNEDPEEFDNPDEAFDFEERWNLISENHGSLLYQHNDLDVEIEFINSDASEYLENEFEGGVIYDGVWTEERPEVTRSLADRIESNSAFLSESSAELFEKPTGGAKKEINRLIGLGIPLSENQVEMFSNQKKSTIQDIRNNNVQVEGIETYRMSEPIKMVGGEEKQQRNLLRHNAGSMHDKGIHDWGKILSTLAASDQLEEQNTIELDQDESVYRKAIAELSGSDIVFDEDGGWINNSSLEDPSSSRRINDGYTKAKAEINGIDIDVVTSLVGWDRQIEKRIEELEDRFDVEKHDVEVADGIDDGIVENIAESNLIYGRDGGKEVRAEYIETDKADYLVSTGGEMFTLKKEDEEITVLAYGGSDWHAEFLEEGIDALAYGEEMTVDIQSSMMTNRILEDVTDRIYRNSQGSPVRVDAQEYEGLEEVILEDIGSEFEETEMSVEVGKEEYKGHT